MFEIMKQIKALIQYRHLAWDLAIKDIKVKYRNPVLGFFWTLLIPLVMVFIFKFVFSTILKAQIEDYPFFIYLMTAIFPWSYFATSINGATESILSNRELIKKTYFPRQIIPISIVLAGLINFIPTLIVMFIILALFKMPFTLCILLIPGILLIQTMLTIGLALIVSSLQVILRDVKYVIELLLMAWLYLSPGFYSLSLVADISDKFLKIYLLNPFVGLFTFYRMALLKDFINTLPDPVSISFLFIWTITISLALFFFGFFIFRKCESQFSDLI